MSLSRPIQRLSDATLASLPPQVARPAYDRARTRIGVVHFGPGAFHRAHQAFYFDRMLAADPGLAISAVSLRSDAVRAALAPQDGLYSLIEREAEPTIRVIGAIREVLTAPSDPQAVLSRLADPNVRLVTATVTEKGYGLTPAGDLDLSHPQVQADLARPPAPQTLVGWLIAGLKQRQARAGGGGLTVLSCDNLSGNGGLLRGASLQFAQACGEAELARWIEGEVRFPDSMVDSITPATDEPLRREAQARLGLSDAWPIQRERFVQWVIGGDLGPDAEIFASAGVTLAADVAPFERAKLRLLNGAHSTLAYIGLRLGHQTVAQAMGDARLAAFVDALMREDIAPFADGDAGVSTLKPTSARSLQRFRAIPPSITGCRRSPGTARRSCRCASWGPWPTRSPPAVPSPASPPASPPGWPSSSARPARTLRCRTPWPGRSPSWEAPRRAIRLTTSPPSSP